MPLVASSHSWFDAVCRQRTNASNINFSLSVTKLLQPLGLAIFTTWSPFNLLICLLFLAHQPPPHWKSQIAHSDMHHPVPRINFQIHSVSLTSPVCIHLLIHLSTHLSHHRRSRHPSLLHCFTAGSKPIFSTDPSNLRLLLPTGLPHDNGTGVTGPITLIILFLVLHFNFLFIPRGRLSRLPVSFSLHVKYTLSYRIVSLWVFSDVCSYWQCPFSEYLIARFEFEPLQVTRNTSESSTARYKKQL